MRRGRNNGITMARGTPCVNRLIGGPPVGHNTGGRPRLTGDSGPLRRWVGPSDEHIDDAARRSPVRVCRYPGRHPLPARRPRIPGPHGRSRPPSRRRRGPGGIRPSPPPKAPSAASSPWPGRGPGSGPLRPDPERRSSSDPRGAGRAQRVNIVEAPRATSSGASRPSDIRRIARRFY